jgi:hypothetical protein
MCRQIMTIPCCHLFVQRAEELPIGGGTVLFGYKRLISDVSGAHEQQWGGAALQLPQQPYEEALPDRMRVS